MENIAVEVGSCEADSTVEGKETTLGPQEAPPLTPLQILEQLELETASQWADILKERDIETNRVRQELEEKQKELEFTANDVHFQIKLRETALRGMEMVQKSLADATALLSSLQNEIYQQQLWRPPSEEMSHVEQMKLSQRVHWMKQVTKRKRIPMPDESDDDDDGAVIVNEECDVSTQK